MKNKLFTQKYLYLGFIFALAIIFVGAGCNGAGSKEAAPTAIEAYYQALVANDLNQMIYHSCSAWEENAQEELLSFAAVSAARLEGLDCQSSGEADGFTLVTCNGKLIADYGAEDLVIELNERTYKVVFEGGEWRMCGYQ